MTATLKRMTFEQVQAALKLSLGRPVSSADRLEMTDFVDCVRNDFWWADGACYSELHDSQEEALEQARRMGFVKNAPPAERAALPNEKELVNAP